MASHPKRSRILSTTQSAAQHAFLGAGAARLIFKSKREFQLHIPALLEMRHGDRQERDSLLVRVIREDRAYQLLGVRT
jgi:hypothetical protein